MASFAATTRILKSRVSAEPFSALLARQRIEQLCDALDHRRRRCFWNPTAVLLTFLRQILLPNCSCRQTVAFTLSEACPLGGAWRPASDPSAYSQARQRLPLGVFEQLGRDLAVRLAEPDQRWRGHRVRVVDGSSVSMPDTPALQRVFPQPATQAAGCGFPVARLLAVFCWSSGALLHWAIDSLRVGELNLFRRLLEHIAPQDVILGDRLFGNYVEIALVLARGANAVCRVNRARRVDLRQGLRLGKHDRLMTWHRPDWVTRGRGSDLPHDVPNQLTLRVVRIKTACRRAFRQRRIDLVTTLLDPVTYPTEALGQLYQERWLAELNLRSLKTTLGMDTLRCRSPQMVRKEVAMFHVAYNLIRMLMVQSARQLELNPQRLSFAGVRQRLLAFLPRWRPHLSPRACRGHTAALLADIATDALPNRPNRHEPRAIKRRRKSYPWLVHPRYRARNTNWYDKR